MKKPFKPDPFNGKHLATIFNFIYENNYWQGEESICGVTSGIEATKDLRRELQSFISNYNIQTILDVPCGDFAWMNKMNLNNIKYLGGDIVPAMIENNRKRYSAHHINFKIIDICSNSLPKVDLIICRDCLVHLDFNKIHQAIQNIVDSESTYLACTTFAKNKFNYDIKNGDWRTLNMQRSPFNFPEPFLLIDEYCPLGDGAFSDKALGIWYVADIWETMHLPN
ncbi:MAG: class I SAM-dependent methyltransferase [Bacteroidota bacterium]